MINFGKSGGSGSGGSGSDGGGSGSGWKIGASTSLVVMKDVERDKTNLGFRQYKFLSILWI